MIKKLDINYIKKEYKKIHNLFLVGNYEKVIEKTKVLLKKDPSQTTFYNLIGLSYKQLKNFELAEKTFNSGLKVNSKSTSILCNLGALYRNWEKFELAEETFQRAIEINPKDLNVIVNYANLKRDLNQMKESLEFYEKGFKLNNNHETLLINYAGAFQVVGDFDKSKEILRILHQKYPNNIVAHKMYSGSNFYTKDDEHQKLMIDRANDTNLPDENKSTLYFAIAKSFSDQNNYEKSAEYFIKANEKKFKTIKNYNFRDEENLFKKIKDIFNKYEFDKNVSKNRPNLIFIVGLPRSGTTLTHQIISSHSKVFGAGELSILRSSFLDEINHEEFVANLLNNKNNFSKNLADKIFNKFQYYHKQSIILDKAPLNFLWIGFIKILFPDAKIIHSKRNLKDTALSIYKNVFDASSLSWTYDQKTLLKFINMYQDMMDFWDKKIPDYIYECNYETLVNDKNNETKKIINFCNLEWEDNCMDHTKNKTGIKTVSLAQARKPVYKSSVDLNKNYKKYLEFLDQI